MGKQKKDDRNEFREVENQSSPILFTSVNMSDLLWNGSRTAPCVQRIGAALIGGFVIGAAGIGAYYAVEERSIILAILSLCFLGVGVRIVIRIFHPKR